MVDSLVEREFDPSEIDAFLYTALLYWVKTRDSGNNVFQTTSEMTQRRMDNLSSLLVKGEAMTAVSTVNGVTTFDLNSLAFDYFKFERAEISVSNCDNRIPVTTVSRHGDLNHILQDEFRKPSLKWRRAVITFGKGSSFQERYIYLHTNEVYSATTLHLDYYKLPREVSIGGYNDIDGSPKSQVDFDIPSEYVEEVVALAALLAAGITKDPGYQLKMSEVKLSE